MHAPAIDPATAMNRIRAIYEREKPHILPYIGAAYSAPSPNELRVMSVGINAYYAEADAPTPGTHREFFETKRYRYQKSVMGSADLLGKALVEKGSIFDGKHFTVERSLYATNAIKIWLPISRGKRSNQVTDEDYERHLSQWHDEIATLTSAGLLPHILIVHSREFWDTAWKTFFPRHGGGSIGVEEYTAEWGVPHRLNRVVVRQGEDRHVMLLIRLRHPSARQKEGSARWLLEHQGFKKVAFPPIACGAACRCRE